MIKAINDRLIVRRVNDTGATNGGIILPSKDRVYTYVVEDIGPDCDRYLPGLNIGDTIVISHPRALTEIDHNVVNNETVYYYSMRIGDVVCAIS